MKTLTLLLTASLLLGSAINAAEIASAPKVADSRPQQTPPRIQLAILLDTSNSMDGLINQARTQLWKIVNELATTKCKDREPHLEVALYEYGNDSLSAATLHVRQVIGFTDNLDCVSEELYALTTNGGQEYCGAVIRRAVDDLDWSDSTADLKMIVIAGNEPFSQGPVDFRESCRSSIAKGITITTIHCGSEEDGIETGWKEGAAIAEGSYLCINQNEPIVTVPTPFDDKLSQLSIQVNATYLYFGDQKKAREQALRQEAQDTNAANSTPAAAADRALFKASRQYDRASGDLLNALANGRVKLKDLKDEELPAELRQLSKEKRQRLIESRRKERARIQQEIKTLSRQRQEFLAEAAEKAGDYPPHNTLDAAVLQAIREQAVRKQFTSPQN